MTLGIYSRLEHIITNPSLREFIDPYIIDIKKEIDDNFIDNTKFMFYEKVSKKNCRSKTTRFVADTGDENSNEPAFKITIKPTRAYHDDFSQYSDSYGYTIQINDEHSFKYNFGYTGDTSWTPDVMNSYKDCDALLVHLGSLIDRKSKNTGHPHKEFSDYKDPKNCFKLVKKEKHPYFVGMLHFLTKLGKKRENKTLVLMSEFGEELRGKIRIDFIRRINKAYPEEKPYVLPVDVGLDVILKEWKNDEEGPRAKCVLCNNYIPINRENVDFETYGLDEGLFLRVQNLYEVGFP